MLEQLHLAAQYLATAGISFVEKKSDDSHTNLGWDAENLRLSSRFLASTGYQLGLSYQDFSLEWLKAGNIESSFTLNQATHTEAVAWIKQQVSSAGIEGEYQYSLHYDLPYESITDSFKYELSSKQEMERLAGLLTLAQTQFSTFMEKEGLNSEIRVWPHHFDLGIYTTIDAFKNLYLGSGLAIPDSLVDDLYYYVAGYKEGKGVQVSTFKALSQGKWAENWNGAIMPSTGKSGIEINAFLGETLQIIRENA